MQLATRSTPAARPGSGQGASSRASQSTKASWVTLLSVGLLSASLVWGSAPAWSQTAPATPTEAAPAPSTAPPAITPPVPAPAPQVPAASDAPAPAPEKPAVAAPAPTVIPAPTPDSSSADNNAQAVDLPAQPVAVFSGTAQWDNGFEDISKAFVKLRAELARAGIEPAGKPFTVFLQTDDQGFRYDAMIPIAAIPAGKDQLSPTVKLSQSPGGKTLKFEHRGAYDDIDSTYEAITAYLDEKGIEAKNLFIEQYLVETKDSEDTKLAVDIYVFIK